MTVFERLKKEDIYPWQIEIMALWETLSEDDCITKDEQEEILKTENLHKFLQNFYQDFRPKVEVPENVKKAYEAAKKDYAPANICEDLLYGVCEYWYDDVLNSWIDAFYPIEDGILSLYLCDREEK